MKELEKQIGSRSIAYTTADGINMTWEKLYEQRVWQEEFSQRYAKLSSKPDWEENAAYSPTYFSPDTKPDWDYEYVNASPAARESITGSTRLILHLC